MAILEVRQKQGDSYTVLRRETDVSLGFQRIATFSLCPEAVDAIMASATLRVAVLTVFQGPYETGVRPSATPTVGNAVIDPELPHVIDAALLAREKKL